MQTPYLPRSLFESDFQRVYEPAEDSFLLLDALELDLDVIKRNCKICLECGSGSGIIVTALAKALESCNKSDKNLVQGGLIIATDINPDACRTTKKSADYHSQSHRIHIINTNLAEALVDRLEGSIDLIIFNPPYVPTCEEEMRCSFLDKNQEASQLNLSWAGGSRGRKLIDIFLNDYVPKLLSKPSGSAYIVVLDKNDPIELSDCLVAKFKIQGRIVIERRTSVEHLYVIRYQWLV